MSLEINGTNIIVRKFVLSLLAFGLIASTSFVKAEVVEVSILKMRFVRF